MLPRKEIELFREEQKEFIEGFGRALAAARARVEERTLMYDTDTPIWIRVTFPEGFIQELKDRAFRIESGNANYARGAIQGKAFLEMVQDEALDLINYGGFIHSIATMLMEQAKPPITVTGGSQDERSSGSPTNRVDTQEPRRPPVSPSAGPTRPPTPSIR